MAVNVLINSVISGYSILLWYDTASYPTRMEFSVISLQICCNYDTWYHIQKTIILMPTKMSNSSLMWRQLITCQLGVLSLYGAPWEFMLSH